MWSNDPRDRKTNPPEPPPPPPSALHRFSGIVWAVIGVVLGRSGVMPHPMIQAINQKVTNIGWMVQHLADALAAGTLKTRRSPTSKSGVKRKPPAPPPAEGAVRLPRQFGWLIPLVPLQAINLGSQLAFLFTDPEMAALLAASPRIVKALRPLCWMLGTRLPPPYSPPPRPRKPYVAPKVKVERPVKERKPLSSRWPAWPPVPGSGSDGRIRHERARSSGKAMTYSEQWLRDRQNRG